MKVMDCNLIKKLANFFKFFLCILEKSLKTDHGLTKIQQNNGDSALLTSHLHQFIYFYSVLSHIGHWTDVPLTAMSTIIVRYDALVSQGYGFPVLCKPVFDIKRLCSC